MWARTRLAVMPPRRESRAPGDGADYRCHCGNLLARLVPEGVELRCRRCKRTLVVPLSAEGAGDPTLPNPAPLSRSERTMTLVSLEDSR